MSRPNAQKRVRLFVLDRDDWLCQYCGCEVDRNTGTVDHIVPASLGGLFEADNLRTACHACNQAKGDRSTDWFRMFLAIGNTPYAGIITIEQYHRLRGLGVPLEPLPQVTFFYEALVSMRPRQMEAA
jgi:hypothetical protein